MLKNSNLYKSNRISVGHVNIMDYDSKMFNMKRSGKDS